MVKLTQFNNMQHAANVNNEDTQSSDVESLTCCDDPRPQLPALLLALAKENVERALELLRHGADVNQVDVWGQTALHYAVNLPHPRHMISVLIDHGANVTAVDNQGYTPLQCAVPLRSSITDVFEPLLKAGARMPAIDGGSKYCGSLIMSAVKEGQSEYLQKLFHWNTHPFKTSASKLHHSPIHWAANTGKSECFRILVQNGFDPNEQINCGPTPVHEAIKGLNDFNSLPYMCQRIMKTLQVLLEVNAEFETAVIGNDDCDPDLATAATPFEYALHYDVFDAAHFLADIGANIQSIRRICRHRGIQALPPLAADEQAAKHPGESANLAELLSLLRKAASPWSLCSLSRSVVRRQLGRRIKDVNELDIPVILKDYVTFNYHYAS